MSGARVVPPTPQIVADARAVLRGDSFTAIVHLVSFELHDETRYAPVRGLDGEVVEILGVAIDLTDRRRAEAAFARSEARRIEVGRLASLGTLAAKAFPLGVWCFSISTPTIWGFNRATRRTTLRSAAQKTPDT